MFGAMMFCSKFIMEGLPNIHPVAMFVILLTVVYRSRALIPIYIYVILDGLRWGFGIAWLPYLYIWLILWGAAMLLPRSAPRWLKVIVYPVVAMLHGLLFGILYAPAQAVLFGLNFKQTIAWVIAGFPYDVLHGVGNLVMALLVLPLSELLFRLERKYCG
jgi:energy-coupling factor transport system substrate-specific component